MFIMSDVSQYKSDKYFYSIYLTDFEGTADYLRNDILSLVREKHFKTGKKVRNRKVIYQESDIYKYSYNLSDSAPMKWKKLKNGVLVESSQIEKKGVYSIVSYGADMLSPVKKINFSLSHHLLGNEYYTTSNPDIPYKRVFFSADKKLFLEIMLPNGTATKTLLILCEYIANEKIRNEAIHYCGSPEIIAKTDKGFYYFCNFDRAKNIENFLANVNKKYFDMTSEDSDMLEYKLSEEPANPEELQEDQNDTALKTIQKSPCNNADANCPYACRCNPFVFSSSNESVYFFGNTENKLMNGYGITTSEDGIVLYNGHYTNNLKDGFGTAYYSNGNISHIGSWKNGKKEGVGVHFDPTTKTITIGSWENDTQVNVGSVFDERGNLMFIGNWSEGIHCGAEVSYSNIRGNIFVGKYNDNERTNEGTLLTLTGKLLYRGEFRNNKKYGFGIEYDENENVLYEGYFKDDIYSGKGILHIENNHTIEGNFNNGVIEGIAKEKDETGFVIYEGEWKNNVYNGKGCRYFSGGGRYEGQFETGIAVGVLNGYNAENELVYSGEWKNDMFNGYGVYFSDGKKIYEGNFKNDSFNGIGTEYANDEVVYKGDFVNNLRQGLGTSYYLSKPIYSGQWKQNYYNGWGVLYNNGEITAIGQFLNGKKHGRIDRIKNNMLCAQQVYKDDELCYSIEYDIELKDEIKILYASNMKNNVMNGMGCTFDSYGSKKDEGLFVDGELVKIMKVNVPNLEAIPINKILKKIHSDIHIRYFDYVVEKQISSKVVYTGILEDGKPYGPATASFRDHIYTGSFVNGCPNGMGTIYENSGTVFEGEFSETSSEGCIELSFSDNVIYYFKRNSH